MAQITVKKLTVMTHVRLKACSTQYHVENSVITEIKLQNLFNAVSSVNGVVSSDSHCREAAINMYTVHTKTTLFMMLGNLYMHS